MRLLQGLGFLYLLFAIGMAVAEFPPGECLPKCIPAKVEQVAEQSYMLTLDEISYCSEDKMESQFGLCQLVSYDRRTA